jgi:UDP-2-acetamido-2,6-beta-L-arabino-hexul-4-ose reductase
MKELEVKRDNRGILVEVFKMPLGGQVHYVVSKPGVIRGKHYHTRKVEEFCVIQGQGNLILTDLNTKITTVYSVSGEKPVLISVPKNTVHELVNVADEDMITLVWNSEIFDPKDPDTITYVECSICRKEISDNDYHTYGSQCKECRTKGWSDI